MVVPSRAYRRFQTDNVSMRERCNLHFSTSNMLCSFLWCLLCLPFGACQTRMPDINCQAPFYKEEMYENPANHMDAAFRAAKEKMADQAAFEHKLAYQGRLIDPTIPSADARHYYVMYEFPEASEMDHMQRYYEGATKYLQDRMHLTPNQIQFSIPGTLIASSNREINQTIHDCKDMNVNVTCNASAYRTANGSCNNLRNPTWGKAFSCYRRLLPASYNDGVSTIRRSVHGGALPNPRRLSTTLFNDVDIEAKNYTNMVTQFGEFLSHGLIQTPMKRTGTGTEKKEMINCCPLTVPQHPECLPIPIPADDEFFSKFDVTCMNFVRSDLCPNCTLGPRNQMNQLSSFIDGSQIYGSSDEAIKQLRRIGNKGLLESSSTERAGELLPPTDNPLNDTMCSNVTENRICFMAGDMRVNQHPGLTSMHTLWLQQHNNIANRLSDINPTWTDERLFQEARKIVGAQLQMIAYSEYLPVVLGEELMERYNLTLKPLSRHSAGRTTYDETIDPTIITEFATAAYRFGHSLIRNEFKRTYAVGSNTEYKLKDYFFFPFILYQGDEIPIMRGLSSQPAMAFDNHIVEAVTNFVYRRNGNDTTGKDLAAINIQRGRDHGLQSYTNYLNLCLNQRVMSFVDLARTGLMEPHVFRRFPAVYSSVEDIDLFAGGVSETALPGATVGPTFGHIIALQFRNMKFGDRFYFEHGGDTPFFTDDQLAQIKRTTLAGILCANSRNSTGRLNNRITFLQKNVFRPPSTDNPLVPCFASPTINLRPWEEVLRPIGG